MNTDKLQQIQAHARAIAALLYDETAPEQLTTLKGIEEAVRGHIQEHVSAEIGHFLLQQQAGQLVGEVGAELLGRIILPEKFLNSKASLEK